MWTGGRVVKHLGISVALVLALASCGDREEILEGERLDIEGIAEEEVVNRAEPIALPRMTANADWPQVGGNSAHFIPHPALSRDLNRAWSVDIGEGNGKRHRITADPVVAGGRVFTLDSRAGVVAHTTGGKALWTRDLTPQADNEDDASGGGLAVGGSALFVTTGFGELTALEAATGNTLWVQDLNSAATGAPTYADGVVYLVTRNAIGWAIDASNGRILWQVLGATSSSGVAGGSAPVVAGSQVIFPLSSGQIIAAIAGPGNQTWAASVAGERRGRAFSRFSDITGDPVVADGVVYAGNHSGRAAAFNASNGQRVWRANEGALSPVAVAGGSVFMVSDENRLLRLDAVTGETIWARDLPFFTRERIRRRDATFAHYGPVLAGGRLVLASNDGQLRQFDPASGNLIGTVELPDGAARNPVVAGGTLYIVTENGQLHAFR